MSSRRFQFSLSRQLALWLTLHLALVLGGVYWLVQHQLGFGWRAFLDGQAGDPVFGYLSGLEPQLQNAQTIEEIEQIVAAVRARTGLAVQIVAGPQGKHAAGDDFPLLREVIRLYAPPGSARPDAPRPEGPRGDSAAPRAGGPPPLSARVPLLPGQRPPGRLGTKVQGYVSEAPIAYWIIFRIPIPESSPLPRQPAMILRTESPWTALRLLHLAPLWWALAAIALGSVAFWVVPLWLVTRRLHRATAATARIAAGNFDVRLAPGPADEIGQLSASINELSQRLAHYVAGQRRFVGDVAHEITAPLARLQFAVAILADRAESEPALQPAVAQVHAELQSTLELVHELLAYSRTGEMARGTPVAVPLADLVRRILATEQVETRATLEIAEALTVQADPRLLERALANLARNFARHAGPVARLRFLAQVDAGRVRLTISDDGPGVSAEILARLGEPFFRPQPAAPDTPGHGLGLAIVRTCVEACGGEVVFRAASPHGFAAEIVLPVGI